MLFFIKCGKLEFFCCRIKTFSSPMITIADTTPVPSTTNVVKIFSNLIALKPSPAQVPPLLTNTSCFRYLKSNKDRQFSLITFIITVPVDHSCLSKEIQTVIEKSQKWRILLQGPGQADVKVGRRCVLNVTGDRTVQRSDGQFRSEINNFSVVQHDLLGNQTIFQKLIRSQALENV